MATKETTNKPSIRLLNTTHLTEDDVLQALRSVPLDASIRSASGLQITVEGAGNAITVTVRLRAFAREYLGRARARDLGAALKAALARLTAKMSNDGNEAHQSRRRAPGLPRLSRALEDYDSDARSEFDDVVREHLGMLKRYVEQELRHLRAAGLLAIDQPDVEDVIDDTFVRALEDLPYRTEVTSISNWLTAHASSVLEHEVALARLQDHEGMSGVELRRLRHEHDRDAGPAVPNDSTQDSDTHVVEAPPPEEILAAEELRTYLVEALADLPTQWRRAVIFAHMDEQPLEAVAATLNAEIAEVEAMLNHADAFLRARLAEDALSLPAAMSPSEYLSWPELPGGFAEPLAAHLTRLIERT